MTSTTVVAVPAAPLPDQKTSKRKQRSITSIERADRRAELAPRRQPHWRAIKSGQSIGYRYMTRGAPGTWLARMWIGGRYVQTPLGDFADKPEGERYDAAVEKAAPFFAHYAAGGSTDDACSAPPARTSSLVRHIAHWPSVSLGSRTSAMRGSSSMVRRMAALA